MTYINFSAYECFQICRRKVFHNKTGDLLLKNVQKAIPLTVTYKQQVEDIFFFLAKVKFYQQFYNMQCFYCEK